LFERFHGLRELSFGEEKPSAGHQHLRVVRAGLEHRVVQFSRLRYPAQIDQSFDQVIPDARVVGPAVGEGLKFSNRLLFLPARKIEKSKSLIGARILW